MEFIKGSSLIPLKLGGNGNCVTTPPNEVQDWELVFPI